MMRSIFPKRAIHLDFHTGPDIPHVGEAFDAKAFAETFRAAHVDSVTLFAMCHHGHLYYDTAHPARHPGLPAGLDLLGEQIEALHEVGILAPIYLSVQCNEYAANQHPEWLALTPALQQVKLGSSAFTAGWQILDMSSPYQDYLAEILDEVLTRYAPVDGIFLDMCWDQPSASSWAVQGMRREGYQPELAEDRARYAQHVATQYMERFRAAVDAAEVPMGVWFNSRPKTNLTEEARFLQHVEIEALPTGGWGYDYFPYVARFVRPLGLPTLSHTGRFFKSWGDNGSLKPFMALKYECCQILSQQMSSGIGDLLPPAGMPHPAVYDLIGSVYAYIEQCEPYVEGATLSSEIAVVTDPGLGDHPGPAALGAVRALRQLQHQFDVISPGGDISSYALVIIPESTQIDADLRVAIGAYLNAGGAVIICGPAALNAEGQPVLAEMGIQVDGPSPYSHTFLHAEPSVAEGLANYGYVMYEPGFRMQPISGATRLVQIGEPYFERAFDHFSGHEYTPEAHLSPYAGAVQHGRVITFAVPILEAYGKHGAPNYRTLLGNCVERLLSQPWIRTSAPTSLQTTVMKQGTRVVVHLLSFSAERRAPDLDVVEDALPLVDLPIAVRLDRVPTRVFLAPAVRELEFSYANGYVETQVTVAGGHALLIIETE